MTSPNTAVVKSNDFWLIHNRTQLNLLQCGYWMRERWKLAWSCCAWSVVDWRLRSTYRQQENGKLQQGRKNSLLCRLHCRLAQSSLSSEDAEIVFSSWAEHLGRPSVARKEDAVLVHISCRQIDRALTLLNNMQRVDLAALLCISAVKVGRLEPTAHASLMESFARYLQAVGLGDMDSLMWLHSLIVESWVYFLLKQTIRRFFWNYSSFIWTESDSIHSCVLCHG